MAKKSSIGIIQKYDLKGHYMFNGTKGAQEGEVYHCEDGKVVGYIWDDNSGLGNPTGKKMFLGLHFPESDSLAFLKVAPLVEGKSPIIWTMQAESPKPGANELNANYNGYWCPADDWFSLVGKLERRLLTQLPNINELKDFPMERVRDVYLPVHMLNAARANGRVQLFTGAVNFRKAQ